MTENSPVALTTADHIAHLGKVSICPASWRMPSDEYARAVHFLDEDQRGVSPRDRAWAFLLYLVISATTVLICLLGVGAPVGLSIAVSITAPTGVFGSLLLAEALKRQRAVASLTGKDPSQVVALPKRTPGPLVRCLLDLEQAYRDAQWASDGATPHPDDVTPHDLARAMSEAVTHVETNYDDGVRFLAERSPDDASSILLSASPELSALLSKSLHEGPEWGPEKHSRVFGYAVHFERRETLLAKRDRTPEPQPAPVASVPDETQPDPAAAWAAALADHNAVREAWGLIASDPLSALSHSALLDVTQPRTASFIEALGAADDMRAFRGEATPGDPEHVLVFVTAVRRARDAWAEALSYSEQVGTRWLAPAQADLARKATALLRTAANETATLPERAAAARKAADLLTQVHSFVLPEAAAVAIEAQTRLALTTSA